MLQRIFTRYNKKYFSGKLGHTQVGWNEALSDTLAMAVTVTSVDDTVNSITHTIQIDPELRMYAPVVKLTLLHEMCHVKLYPYLKHGKRFDAEMLHLAIKGGMDGLW